MITMLAQVPQLHGDRQELVVLLQGQGRRQSHHRAAARRRRAAGRQRAARRDRLRMAVQLVSTARRRPPVGRDLRPPGRRTYSRCRTTSRSGDRGAVGRARRQDGPGSIGTPNVAAYDAYLRGKQLVDRRETKALEEGVALLEKSVAADPNFARAWIELSGAYSIRRVTKARRRSVACRQTRP